MIKIWQCQRCDHDWASRLEYQPKKCPKCQCTNWDRPAIIRVAKQKEVKHREPNPLDKLEVGQTHIFKWFVKADGFPDEVKNRAIHQMIGRYATKHGTKYWKNPTGRGIEVTRMA